jgi:SAM-dependent methyltransferase
MLKRNTPHQRLSQWPERLKERMRGFFREKDTAQDPRNWYEEQMRIQHFSNRFRGIEDYDSRLAVIGSSFRIRQWLDRRTAEGRTRWLDVPCGVGAALQQGVDDYGTKLEAVGIDLIDWNASNLHAQDMEELKRRYPAAKLAKMLDKGPFEFHLGDMKDAAIEGGADLITSMCGIYYHEDPLGVWQNLYNQLRPGGTFLAHFMLPRSKKGLAQNYKRFASALRKYCEAEIWFSDDGRRVREAALVVDKKDDRKLFVAAVPVNVKPYNVTGGLHGRFQIKAVDYELASQPVLPLEKSSKK